MDAVPDVDRRVGEVVLADVGAEMKPFPTRQNLASWAGVCPGTRTVQANVGGRGITPGNRKVTGALVQVAWAASHTKNTYLASNTGTWPDAGAGSARWSCGPFDPGDLLQDPENGHHLR